MTAAAAVMHCVILAGLGGEQEYEQRFTSQAQALEQTLKASGSGNSTRVLYGAGATRDAIRSALKSIADSANPDDSVMVVLIGHGSVDGPEYKFNIPGPDLSATELGALLNQIKAQRQLVVNTTSASGSSTEALARPNRVVITATKSGTERNATIFARYWADALRDAAADADKNEVISATEAFRFAESKTKQFYETQKRLATEHPAITGAETRFAVLRIGSL